MYALSGKIFETGIKYTANHIILKKAGLLFNNFLKNIIIADKNNIDNKTGGSKIDFGKDRLRSICKCSGKIYKLRYFIRTLPASKNLAV